MSQVKRAQLQDGPQRGSVKDGLQLRPWVGVNPCEEWELSLLQCTPLLDPDLHQLKSVSSVVRRVQILHKAEAQGNTATATALPPLSNCRTHTSECARNRKYAVLVVLQQAHTLDTYSPSDL